MATCTPSIPQRGRPAGGSVWATAFRPHQWWTRTSSTSAASMAHTRLATALVTCTRSTLLMGGSAGVLRSGPAVARGIVYVGSVVNAIEGRFSALDAANGRELWRFDPWAQDPRLLAGGHRRSGVPGC